MDHCELNRSGRRLQLFKTWGGLLPIMMLFGAPAYGQPANDDCGTATVIPSTAPDPVFVDMVNTTTATLDPTDPLLTCNTGDDGNNTVWYEWTPAADVTANISTEGSTEPGGDLDTAHGVFTGACGALTEVACVDIGLNDDLFFDATGGVTYHIKFGEFAGGVGGGDLVVTVGPLPEPEQFVFESTRDGLSDPISSLVPAPAVAALSNRTAGISTAAEASTAAGTPTFREVPMLMRDDGKAESSGENGGTPELLTEKMAESNFNELLGPAGIQPFKKAKINLLQIFDGAENDDNAIQVGGFLAPPDTDGDVGLDHYVQMTNLVTTIFDKGGSTVLGPFPNTVFWTGLGGVCENVNSGDPIVLYDEETNRWLISQFALGAQFSLCIALSETGDPTGSYFQHEFDFSAFGVPDYPKYGFVTDAIGVMFNLFAPPSFGFDGVGLGAIDKAEAMSAGPTTMVWFKLPGNEFGFLPGDNDGPVFNNMPPTFFTNNGSSGDRIDVWEITPDFAVPVNSTISEVAKIPVSPFDTDICNAFRERCIDQPGSGTGSFPFNITFLEAISSRLMHRLQLRDFGKEKWAVVNHTVDADGSGKAGVRWYEFRNKKDKGWELKKSNTFSPDGDHRWMGSIAMNAKGEVCVGYSISSQTTHPSIGVACRRGRSSHLNRGEIVVFDGNVAGNVQRQTGRWGDYSAMAIDPVDDTFWYTQEFAEPNQLLSPPLAQQERFGWATKIVQIDP